MAFRMARSAATLATFFLWGTVAPLNAAPAPSTEVSTFTLDNGMQVVVIPDHRIPIVAHSVWYKVGSVDDGENLSGRAHFLEHMMFKATKKYPKRYLDQAVARAGGFNNATTNLDVTNYYEIVPKEFLPEMMAIEADRMTNIQFTSDEFEIERGAILQERKSRIDSAPMNRLRERIRAVLYAGTPYEKMPAGTVADIQATTTDSAYELYRKAYGPNNAVLVLAGDITRDEAERLAKEHYGPIPAMARVPERPSSLLTRPIPSTRLVERDPQVPFSGVGRAYLAPSEEHDDYYPLLALMNYLNIYTGRLNTELVRDKKLASAASAEFEVARLGGIFQIGASVAPGIELKTLEAALDAIIADVRMNGAPEGEIRSIVKSWKPVLVFERDDIIERMNYYGWHVSNGRSIEWIHNIDTRMSQVTAADIQRVAARYLVPENAVTGELHPATAAAGNTAQ